MRGYQKFIIGILGATAVTSVVLDTRGRKKRKKDTQEPFYESHHQPCGFYEKHMKRPLDCILASGALVVFSPILLATSVLVKKKLGSPVLFTQDRPGKDEKIFKLYKFRTMTDERDENGELLPNEVRLTKFGEKLRSTSIDELPELINIAEGDMAIVGPRPLLKRYLQYYTKEECKRHDVRPGLTGLAQVTNNGNLDWTEKFKVDVKYTENISFKNDLNIILRTLWTVLVRKDTAIDGIEPLDIERGGNLYRRYIKRLLDIILSGTAVVILSPVLCITAILVRNRLGSPVLFTQDRPGRNERIFKLYKFRSMTDARDEEGNLLPDDVRLTAFGKKLRSTSIDELPELFNILKGDMSIVGPRPLLVRYLPYYTAEERHRHDVRPGLTGWAQVNGRNFITWEETFKLDIEYVKKCSFQMDFKIIMLTIKKVLSHADITDATQGTKDSSGRHVHDALDIERGGRSVT